MKSYREFREHITENLQKMMRIRRLNQTQLAVYSNLSLGTISGLLSGKRDPSVYVIWTVSRALKIEPEELIGDLKYGKSEYIEVPKKKRSRYDAGIDDDDTAFFDGLR